MNDKQEALIYRYRHEGCRYYGQGLDEGNVRIAMETRLRLPLGTLQPGYSHLNVNELRKVTSSRPDIRYLGSRFRLPRHVNIERVTIGELLKFSGLNRDQVNKVLHKELNVSTEIVSGADNNTTIKDLRHMSNDRLLIRTHKIFKGTVPKKITDENGNIQYIKKDVVLSVHSRIDELKAQIEKLLKLDYWLIVEVNDYENKLEELKSSLVKAEHLMSKAQELSQDDRNKYGLNLVTLPKEIEQLEKKVAMQNARYYNTGFYVNANDQYEEKTYNEVLAKFDEIQEKIRTKLYRYYLQNIPFNENLTLEEALDSYMLVRSENNSYVRVTDIN